MNVTVCFFHTVGGLTGTFDDLAAEYVPETEYFHLVDESVLQELLSVGEQTPSITNRICAQLSLAERAGGDVVLDTCSSTSPAVDVARELVSIPIVKIDDPMAEQAVEVGGNIAVIATAESTLGPSTDLIDRKADKSGASITIDRTLVDDALEELQGGNKERHDRLVTDAAQDAAPVADVVVLAQASMSHLQPELAEETSVPVLSSPQMAMERIADVVEEVTDRSS